ELSVGAEVIEPLLDRLVGRIAFEDVANPETGDMIISKGDLISEDQAKLVDQAGIKEVTIRSAFTCNTKHGVCKQCYGRNLTTSAEVEVDEAERIIAAQAIGVRGTQPTMRTVHNGGVAGGNIRQGPARIQKLVEARNPKGQAV